MGFWVNISPMRIWISRLLIGTVTAWNLQAALTFLLYPYAYLFAFELAGDVGQAVVRGIGALFLMWNVPYLAALWNPIRYRQALILAALMQLTGLIGESYVLSTLPPEHAVLQASILRFIIFDGLGVILLSAAWIVGKFDSQG